MIQQRLLAFTLLGVAWVLWLLLALSVLSVAVMLERAAWFARRRIGAVFPELVRLCQAGELAQAATLATGSAPDAMETAVIQVAEGLAVEGQEAVEKAVASTIDRRRLEYEQWLFVLGTLGNNAPFIGLFGTVIGIIRAFADLAVSHAAGPGGASTVMSGISEALVATALGLFVAIPAVLAYNIFQRLLKRVIGRSNALGNAIAAGLHVRDNRGAAAPVLATAKGA